MKKKILTLDDLYNYYSSTSQRTRHFSAKDDDSVIAVRTFGKIKYDADSDAREGLTPCFLQSCHINLNNNGSEISRAAMEKALPSFEFRPILGYIHEVDGKPEFYEHNEGEVAIGVISNEVAPYLEYDEEKGKTYTNLHGYIFDDYSQAKEILEREGECKVSVELYIRESTYNAKEKVLHIEDFFCGGITILGKTPDGEEVIEGMSGSNITLQDFSKKKNSCFSLDTEKKLFEILENLNENLSSFNKNYNLGKEENQKAMDKFEELLSKYEKTAEDITFEYEGLDDEALEAKFIEVFGEIPVTEFDGEEGEEGSEEPEEPAEPTEEPTEEPNEDPVDPTPTEPVVEPTEPTVEPTTDPVVTDNTEDDEPVINDDEQEKKRQFKRVYDLSFDEIQMGLYALISADAWIMQVYEDNFIYQTWDEGAWRNFGQKYSKNGDELSLEGERYEVFPMWLTADEKAYVDVARANYSAVSEELEKYKSEPEKMEIFESKEWDLLSECKEFNDLKLQENHFSLSKDEIVDKLNNMLLEYVKKGTKTAFSAKKEAKPRAMFAFGGRQEDNNDFLTRLRDRANGKKDD